MLQEKLNQQLINPARVLNSGKVKWFQLFRTTDLYDTKLKYEAVNNKGFPKEAFIDAL